MISYQLDLKIKSDCGVDPFLDDNWIVTAVDPTHPSAGCAYGYIVAPVLWFQSAPVRGYGLSFVLTVEFFQFLADYFIVQFLDRAIHVLHHHSRFLLGYRS